MYHLLLLPMKPENRDFSTLLALLTPLEMDSVSPADAVPANALVLLAYGEQNVAFAGIRCVVVVVGIGVGIVEAV